MQPADEAVVCTVADVQAIVEDGTFFRVLMRDTRIEKLEMEEGGTQLTFHLPEWYNRHVTGESKVRVEAALRARAEEGLDGMAHA